MKKFYIIVLSIAIPLFSYAQDSEVKGESDLISGSISKKGKTVEGYFKPVGTAYTNGKTFDAPWQFQGNMKFISAEDFDKKSAKNSKLKNKDFEKLGPKDIEGYTYDLFTYRSVKYSDASALGTGMLAKKLFMRIIDEDKISTFHFFASPPPVATGEAGFEPHFIECAKEQVVYRIGDDGKLKLVANMNVKKELADCDLVVQKQKDGQYQAVGSKNDKPSKLNQLINKQGFGEETRLMAIHDYNENCE